MTEQATLRGADDAARAIATLQAFGRVRLRVSGSSMLPALRPGDEVQFEHCPAIDARRGDVVLVRDASGVVIHRVLERTDSGLITQGDSLAQPDPPVDDSNVLGRMISASRRGRPVRHRQSPHLGDHLTRWLFRRVKLTTSVFLHLQRLSSRPTA